MKKITFLYVLLIIFSFSIYAQNKKLNWETEFCQYEGTYNSKKYTAQQLKNTQRLLGLDFEFDTASTTVWKYEEIDELDFAAIEADYQKKHAELKKLNIVKVPYWENVRRRKLKELETYYDLAKATMASYKTPKSLRDYKYANTCLAKYGEPLIESGDALLKVWESVNIETRGRNADPKRIERIFDEQRISQDALKYAVVEVTAFGWWNCANSLIDQGDDSDILENNFLKLFVSVKKPKCDEP